MPKSIENRYQNHEKSIKMTLGGALGGLWGANRFQERPLEAKSSRIFGIVAPLGWFWVSFGRPSGSSGGHQIDIFCTKSQQVGKMKSKSAFQKNTMFWQEVYEKMRDSEGAGCLKIVCFNTLEMIWAIFEKHKIVENGCQDGSKMAPKSIHSWSGGRFLTFSGAWGEGWFFMFF